VPCLSRWRDESATLSVTATTAPRSTANPAAVVAAFAGIYVVWGSTFLAIRYAVETIPPFAMMSLRCLLGGAILLTIARVRDPGFAWPSRRQWAGAAAVGALFFLGCHGVLAYAEQRVPSGLAALFLATVPLMVPVLAWWLADGRPISLRTGLALLAAFGGVALLVAVQGASGGLSVGDALLLLACSLSWALGTIALRLVPVPASPLAAAAAPLLAGGAVLGIVAASIGERLTPAEVSGRSLGGLAYLILAGTVATFGAYVWLLRVVDPGRVATYGFVNPAVAVLLGWAIAGEPIGVGAIVSTVVIIAAVAVVVSERAPKAA
jgi:drug/metabolite transporter (DMT)-like permease